MELRSGKEDLLGALSPAAGVVENRQTLPILGHLLLTVSEDSLHLTGTDLEVELEASCPVTAATPGQATVPARKFLDIVRSLPDGSEIAVASTGNQVRIQAGRSRFTLAGLETAEFPRLDLGDDSREISLPQGALKALLEHTGFAMARDDVRYYLNGILLEWSGSNLRAVATDGHRLALMDRSVAEAPESLQVILPRKGVQELERLLADSEDPAGVTFTDNHVRFRLPGVTFTSKLIEGRFPEYRRVIPEKGDQPLHADRQTLRQALRRTAILSNRKTNGVRLTLKEDVLEVSAENPDQEAAAEEVAVDYDGPPLEIAFNVQYILDAVEGIPGDTVEIHLWDAQSSGLVVVPGDDSVRYVIMPMRL